MSTHAHDRIMKVARTIADLENSDSIKLQHLAEAGKLEITRGDWVNLDEFCQQKGI